MRYLISLILCSSLWAAPSCGGGGCNSGRSGLIAHIIDITGEVPHLPDCNEMVRIAWQAMLTAKDYYTKYKPKDEILPNQKVQGDTLYILQAVLLREPANKLALELLEHCKKNEFPPETSQSGLVIRQPTKLSPNGLAKNGEIVYILRNKALYYLVAYPRKTPAEAVSTLIFHARLCPVDRMGEEALRLLRERKQDTDPQKVLSGPVLEVYECARFVYIGPEERRR